MKRICMGNENRQCDILTCDGEVRYLKECEDSLQKHNDYYVCRKCEQVYVWNGEEKINTGITRAELIGLTKGDIGDL